MARAARGSRRAERTGAHAADWFGGETIAANGMRLELEHPELGTVEMPGVSLKMSGTTAVTPRLADDAQASWVTARADG